MFIFCSTYLRQRVPWMLIFAWIPLFFLLAEIFDGVLERREKLFPLLLPLALSLPLAYRIAPAILETTRFAPLAGEALAGRKACRFFLSPWKHGEDSARRFIQEVARTLSPGDLLLLDFTPAESVCYVQKSEGVLRDIEVVSISNFENFPRPPGRRVYLGRYNATFRKHIDAEKWRLIPRGWLFEIVKKKQRSPGHIGQR
jgi:hypothetical protein